ncbi:MAG: hypothetical protein QOI11_1900 [Candidatus Eremiobacteraeota bacterium]|jgi:uncharacterized protein (DUF2252 family)|nr:hypothetical protein [Candidatus Eremiobacteraeota bacterium]
MRSETIPSAARERAEAGKAVREHLPRTAHAFWLATPARPDPLAVLSASNERRLAHLIPIRHARMAESPLAYYRGSAAMMAHDLATTPVTGLTVQACGDAHLLNFGGFATPERNHIFDLTDFDETLPGPWEWDVKRLATSIVLAARHNGFAEAESAEAALAAAHAYRERMHELAAAGPLAVWYARLEALDILEEARGVDDSQRLRAVEKLTADDGSGALRLREDPPLLYHAAARDGLDVERIVAGYARELAPDVRVLFARYRLLDAAVKVVGVGSVGTRCALALFAADGDTLLLQIKEAARSVLAAHLPASAYRGEGERVVRGQRLMQAASDVFLGWASSGGRDFYVRQFKDKKATADLRAMDAGRLRAYGAACARALAGGHARSGDPAAIAGYLGKSDVFDRALLTFAQSYADQTERDFDAFTAAIARGAIRAA